MPSDAPSSNKRSNFFIIIATLFVLFIGLTGAQVYLNKPETRAQVACYNLSVAHDLVWVGPIEIFAPDDKVLQVKHAQDVHDTYKSCVLILERQAWLRSF